MSKIEEYWPRMQELMAEVAVDEDNTTLMMICDGNAIQWGCFGRHDKLIYALCNAMDGNEELYYLLHDALRTFRFGQRLRGKK